MTDYRLFIAIELPAAAKSAVEKVQKSLQPLNAVRWTPPAQIHLTLQFLGDTPADQIDDLRAALATTGTCRAFSLSLATVGTFPNANRPRIVWAGVKGDIPALNTLHHAVIAATSGIGFPAEKRPFKPHLTIGRVKKWARGNDHRAIAAAVRRANPAQIATVPVTQFHVIRSQLTRNGPIYTPNFTINLSSPSTEPTDVT